MRRALATSAFFCCAALAPCVRAEGRIRIMPPDGAVFAAQQLFDLRVESTTPGLRVRIDGREVTGAPANAQGAALLRRGLSFASPGEHVILAETPDGARAESRFKVEAWAAGAAQGPRARNVILLLGDGM